MSGGMYLAAAGALVQQLRLEVLANNVANISTIG
jgi:flagellar basal-body rod protein FlgF